MSIQTEGATVRSPNTRYCALPHIKGYLVGEDGSFISLAKKTPVFRKGKLAYWQPRKEKRLKIDCNDNGSGVMKYKVKTVIDGKRKGHSIARLVLTAFAPVPEVNIKDCYAWALNRDASNADITNLAWILKSDITMATNKQGIVSMELKPDARLY